MLRLPGCRRGGSVRSARRAARRSSNRRRSYEEWAFRRRAAGLPRAAHRPLQDPCALHLQRGTAAAARHGQDRPPDAEGPVRKLNIDRRTLLIGGGVGVGLIVGYALWPRGLHSDLSTRPHEQAFGNYIKIARDGRITVA